MFDRFYNVVKGIPKGKVASYGTVARLAGYPRCSRQVGWALAQNPSQNDIPCHRVVFSDGRLSEAFVFGGISEQERLLKQEGVSVDSGRVDMKIYSVESDL